MQKHLLGIAHIAKLNKPTESDIFELTSTTVDKTALAILNRHGGCGITTLNSQKKLIFDS